MKIEREVAFCHLQVKWRGDSKYYDPVDSDEGTMFRNIIEDQLESFSDLDVNVRVAILLEMIEKVMRKEE